MEVVKKQVATMMDDSSESKEEYYKNNSNSKSENNDLPLDLGHRLSYSPVPSEHSLKHRWLLLFYETVKGASQYLNILI